MLSIRTKPAGPEGSAGPIAPKTPEAPQTGGFGAEVVARITSRCFDYLERPVERVTGLDVPYPPPGLEHLYLPNEEKILGAIATLYAEND